MAINTTSFSVDGLVSFAESLGEAIGRGVMRGVNAGLSGGIASAPASAPAAAAAPRRRPGRPPKAQSSVAEVPSDRRCTIEGCTNPSRSKGLCSKHYQAERRRVQGKG